MIKKQIELQRKIVEKLKINIVTCPKCGDVLLHEIKDEDVICPHCKEKGEPSEFPDFWY